MNTLSISGCEFESRGGPFNDFYMRYHHILYHLQMKSTVRLAQLVKAIDIVVLRLQIRTSRWANV